MSRSFQRCRATFIFSLSCAIFLAAVPICATAPGAARLNAGAQVLADPPPRHQTSERIKKMITQAHALDKGGLFIQAAKIYGEVIREDPLCSTGWNGRGTCLMNSDHFDEAVNDFNHALVLEPGDSWAMICLGDIAEARHDYKTALSYYDKAIKTSPGRLCVYERRAQLYEKLGDLPAALRNYSDQVRLEPHNETPLQHRGQVNAKMHKFSEAIADFNAAIKMVPDDDDNYKRRGDAYLATGKLSDAVKDYTRVISSDPDSTSSYTGRAEAYEKLGKHDLAVKDRQKIEQIDKRRLY